MPSPSCDIVVCLLGAMLQMRCLSLLRIAFRANSYNSPYKYNHKHTHNTWPRGSNQHKLISHYESWLDVIMNDHGARRYADDMLNHTFYFKPTYRYCYYKCIAQQVPAVYNRANNAAAKTPQRMGSICYRIKAGTGWFSWPQALFLQPARVLLMSCSHYIVLIIRNAALSI